MENLQVDLESTPAVLGVTDRHPRATNSVSDTLERIRKAIRIEKKDLFETEATVQGASRSFDQETPGSPFLNLLKQCAARQPRDRCSPRIPCSHLRKNTPRSDLGFFFFGGKCSKSTRGGARQRRGGDRGRGPLRRREQLGAPLRWLRERAEVKPSTWPCREPTEWSWTSCTGELVVEGKCHPREVG